MTERPGAQLEYFQEVMPILKTAIESQSEVLRRVAQHMAEVIAGDHLIYVFGGGHAGLL